jgi:hypothetical protein
MRESADFNQSALQLQSDWSKEELLALFNLENALAVLDRLAVFH